MSKNENCFNQLLCLALENKISPNGFILKIRNCTYKFKTFDECLKEFSLTIDDLKTYDYYLRLL